MSFTAKELSACIKEIAPPGYKFRKGVGACILEKNENGFLYSLTYTHRSTSNGQSIGLAAINIYYESIRDFLSSVREKYNIEIDVDALLVYVMNDSESKYNLLCSKFSGLEITSSEQFDLMIFPSLKWLLENYTLKRVASLNSLQNIAKFFLSLPLDEMWKYTCGPNFIYTVPHILLKAQHPRASEMIQKLKHKLHNLASENAKYQGKFEVFCDLFCDNDLKINDQLIDQENVNSENSDSLFSPSDIDWHELELILGRKIFDVKPDEPPIQYLYVPKGDVLEDKSRFDLNSLIESSDFQSKFTDYDLLVSFDELICFSQKNDINIFLFPWAHEPYYRRMINLFSIVREIMKRPHLKAKIADRMPLEGFCQIATFRPETVKQSTIELMHKEVHKIKTFKVVPIVQKKESLEVVESIPVLKQMDVELASKALDALSSEKLNLPSPTDAKISLNDASPSSNDFVSNEMNKNPGLENLSPKNEATSRSEEPKTVKKWWQYLWNS